MIPKIDCVSNLQHRRATSSSDTDQADDGESLATNGVTYVWDENTQDFTTRTYEGEGDAVEVVQPMTKRATVKRLLEKAKTNEVSAANEIQSFRRPF